MTDYQEVINQLQDRADAYWKRMRQMMFEVWVALQRNPSDFDEYVDDHLPFKVWSSDLIPSITELKANYDTLYEDLSQLERKYEALENRLNEGQEERGEDS